ncbi:MAG: tetratricopeptide repeat protein [Anaerolineae bacterium]
MAAKRVSTTSVHSALPRARAGAFLATGLVVVLLALLPAGPVSASGAARAADVLLAPIGPPGSIKLLAATFAADLSGNNGSCNLHVVQTLYLYNQDRTNAAELDVGLPSRAEGVEDALSGASLSAGQDTALAPSTPSEGYSDAWHVSLQPDERRTLTLTYDHQLPVADVLRWTWDTTLIAAWGAPDSVRASLHLPQPMTEDALLRIEPNGYRFDGRTISWEYEGGASWPAHAVTLVAPDTWSQLGAARTNGDHRALAQLLTSLQEASQAAEAPIADPFDQIVAALDAGLAQEPANAELRLELVQTYRSRAERAPASRLNYLLLAAQELETLLAQQPDNADVAQSLCQTFLDAAQAADDSGDPAGALTYLEKAGAVPGVKVEGLEKTIRNLTLQWALSLAEQGRTEEALARLEGMLSADLGDMLQRYAPPWTSAHVSVRLEPGRRVVRYALELHAASAERVGPALRALGDRASVVLGSAVETDVSNTQASLELAVPFDSLAQLASRSSALATALSQDGDLLSALVAAPWSHVPTTYGLQEGYLRDYAAYAEQFDLSALGEVLRTEAEYCEWQMVERQNAEPADDVARMENSLVVIALRDQYLDWQSLPSATYWTVDVQIGVEGAAQQTWLVPWGSIRELTIEEPIYHASAIRQALLGGGAALLVILVLLALPRRRRT